METLKILRRALMLAPLSAAVLFGQDDMSLVQNAILEGVQISTEPGREPGEKVVSCYFIFRDKPSHYFSEMKYKQKSLVFEFHDTEKGASPIQSFSEAPITGFTVEQKKFNANETVQGLKPEWHDLIQVTFNLEAIPQIHVTDEYSVISFFFNWTTDPSKVQNYIAKEKKNNIFWWSAGGLIGVGGVLLAVYLWPEPPPPPPEPLDISDLPQRSLDSGGL